MIEEYKLLAELFPENLNKKVNQMIKEGWTVHGTAVVSQNKFCQVMFKYHPVLARFSSEMTETHKITGKAPSEDIGGLE